jgi:hypothetical protein
MAIMVLLGSAAAPAQAQSDFRFLGDTPITKFKQVDIDLLAKALNQALDNGTDGTLVIWASPNADNSGSITPSRGPQGRTGCRKARVENRHQMLYNTTEAVFTSAPGAWRILRDPGTRSLRLASVAKSLRVARSGLTCA